MAPVTSNKVTEFHRRVSHFDLLSGFLILSLFRQRSQSSISPPTATATSNEIGSSMSPPSLSYRSAGAAPQANGKSTKQPPGSILYKELVFLLKTLSFTIFTKKIGLRLQPPQSR